MRIEDWIGQLLGEKISQGWIGEVFHAIGRFMYVAQR